MTPSCPTSRTAHPASLGEADGLITQIRGLISASAQIEFDHALDRRVAESEAWATWVAAPTRSLFEFDADTVSKIATDLRAQLADLKARANERGWED